MSIRGTRSKAYMASRVLPSWPAACHVKWVSTAQDPFEYLEVVKMQTGRRGGGEPPDLKEWA